MSRLTAYGLLTLLGIFVLTCLGLSFPIEIGSYLVFGWILFAIRVLPSVKVEWSGVVLACLCLGLILALTHSFLGWLYRSARTEAEGPKWKAKWTASLIGVVVLMFAAGTAATGIVHQTGWLFTSGERWLSGGRLAARRAQSVNNLKQIGLAFANYSAVDATLPQAASLDAEGRLLHGWQARILPFIEQQDLYNRIDFTRPWDDPTNAPAIETRVNAYLNPGSLEKPGPGAAPSHYSANARVLGGDSARKLNEITDGLANTFIAGEVAANFKPWGYPANWRDPALGINQSPDGFGGPYPGGANFLFADGSVRFIKNTVAPQVFRAISTPAGSEQVNPDAY